MTTRFVIDQNPPGGTVVPRGSTVDLVLSSATGTIVLPSLSEWSEQGTVLTGGPSGSWDNYVASHGFRANSIVLHNGIYHLYYTGSEFARGDGGPGNRAIGVATSPDGVNFSKYSGNPIVTWNPNPGHVNADEEGAYEAVVAWNGSQFVLFYGAITAAGTSSVDVFVRHATSNNGLDFTDQGHVFGTAGNEFWPVGAIFNNGTYYVWMTDSGGTNTHLLTGSNPTSLTYRGVVHDQFAKEEWQWPVLMPDDRVFTYEVSGGDWEGPIKVRETSLADPTSYSSVLQTFPTGGHIDPSVLLDIGAGDWLMYYTDFNLANKVIKLRIAPIIVT